MTNQKIIDGKQIAKNLREELAIKVSKFKEEKNITPSLAVILVGENPASQVYVRNKGIATKEVGMNSIEIKLAENISESELIEQIEKLNNDDEVHGVLVQLPLPKHINEKTIINTISHKKDVDGFHILNSGLLATGQKATVPCTPKGCLIMLKKALNDLTGKHAVVIGRSNIVGKPMAQLLLNENCTVTIVHSKTKNIEEICKQADILVAAVGIPKMVKKSWIKQGAVVIDVGINRIEGENGKSRLVGDVDFDDVIENVSNITPVPGGVGPMTIACLLENTFDACNKEEN